MAKLSTSGFTGDTNDPSGCEFVEDHKPKSYEKALADNEWIISSGELRDINGMTDHHVLSVHIMLKEGRGLMGSYHKLTVAQRRRYVRRFNYELEKRNNMKSRSPQKVKTVKIQFIR